ncbi:MAG TPA: N-acetyltransferase [Candidatus Thermoplasmatota archaeon]|nr:N-acetyltransferase [Candidatus Thermoplasmatota archaeon]
MPAKRSLPLARVRRATVRDHDALRALEDAAFQPWRRASARSLRRSLASPRQTVWLVAHPDPGRRPGEAAGLLVLWHHRSRLRVYDIATHDDVRGQGYGLALMRHAEAVARKEGCKDVSLEADARDAALIAWYRRQGYGLVDRMPDFYAEGRPAVRLRKAV